MGFMDIKTNVNRILDNKKISYLSHTYDSSEAAPGVKVAEMIDRPADKVFKTLVTVGKSGANYVFVIPVASELDLKKAASAAGEKNISMIPQKELLPLTGYIHGGCSPIGMKKAFPTFIHISAENKDTIIFSAGKIGYQVELSPGELGKVIRFTYADIISDIT